MKSNARIPVYKDVELKTTNMNFLEAVKAMKQGHKVKIKNWMDNIYLELKNGIVQTEHGQSPSYTIDLYEATTWMVIDDDSLDMVLKNVVVERVFLVIEDIKSLYPVDDSVKELIGIIETRFSDL